MADFQDDDDGVGFDMVGAIKTEKDVEKESEEIAAFKKMLAKKQKKKKKKKSKTSDTKTDNDNQKNNNDPNNNNNLLNMEDDGTNLSESLLEQSENYFLPNDNRDYPYTVLLDRIFKQLNEKNPNLVKRGSHKLPPPQTALHGTKKTGWGNFKKICSELSRKQEHVKSFFLTEMNTTGNLDQNESFIIKGRWKTKQVESLLKKYIREYVTCNNCRSPKTTLEKDNATRLHFLTCTVCGATRSVAQIKAGFHATTRDDRRAARNAKH